MNRSALLIRLSRATAFWAAGTWGEGADERGEVREVVAERGGDQRGAEVGVERPAADHQGDSVAFAASIKLTAAEHERFFVFDVADRDPRQTRADLLHRLHE